MELALQIISNDETVRNDTIQDLKEFNPKNFNNSNEKRGTISFYDACYQKSFQFNGGRYDGIKC